MSKKIIVCRCEDVTLEDIHAALAYARELVEQDEFHPLPGGLNRGV